MFCNNVFATMCLYIICNHMLVAGYVLLAFGEIYSIKTVLLLFIMHRAIWRHVFGHTHTHTHTQLNHQRLVSN